MRVDALGLALSSTTGDDQGSSGVRAKHPVEVLYTVGQDDVQNTPICRLHTKQDRDLMAIWAGMLRENYIPGLIMHIGPAVPLVADKAKDLLAYMVDLVSDYDQRNTNCSICGGPCCDCTSCVLIKGSQRGVCSNCRSRSANAEPSQPATDSTEERQQQNEEGP